MTRAVRWVVALTAISLAAPSGPPADAAVMRPVHGIHQAYHGTPAARPSIGPVKRYYLSGSQEDQVNKLSGSPTATFSRVKPTGGQTITQVSSPLVVVDGSAWNERFSAFWTGPYAGRIVGDVQIDWYWSSANPLQLVLAPPIEVSVWADPTPDGRAHLIGRTETSLTTGPTPVINTSRVPVSGTVKRALAIQVTTQYVDVGEDLRVSYGSADAPSGFAVPTAAGRVVPLPKVPRNVAANYRGPSLDLQAADIGTQAGEPTIGVTKKGVAFVAGGTLTLDSPVAEGGFTPDVRRSKDGGRTWSSVQPRYPNGTPEPPTSADPYLYVDPSTGRVFNDSLYAACTYLTYSDDEGKTWNRDPAACNSPVNDHQTIVAGKATPNVTTTGYPNVVYYCASQNSATSCGRSLDGGATFMPMASFPFSADSGCGGAGGHIITDPQGRLFMPTGRCGYPAIAISDNAGDSWTRVAVSQIGAANIQTSVASDADGNLYYTWNDATNRLPYLSHSTDHGRTWSTPVMIAPPGVRQVNWTTIVAGDRGRIALVFPGTTQTAPAPPPTNRAIRSASCSARRTTTSGPGTITS